MIRGAAGLLVLAACSGDRVEPTRVLTRSSLDPVPAGRPRPAPTRPASSAPVVQITAAGPHACARHADGTVSCWGGDAQAQLGPRPGPSGKIHATPIGAWIGGALDVATGIDGTCVRRADGVWCWGGGATTPERIGEVTDAVEITRNCAREASGAVGCWTDLLAADRVLAFDGALDLSSYGARTCALYAGGVVECRHLHSSMTTGGGAIVEDGVEVAVGGDRTCVRTAAGTVTCWPQSIGYMLTERAQAVAGVEDALQVVAGDKFACARGPSAVRCWGQIPGRVDEHSVFADIAAELRADEIAAGNDFVCARTGGDVVCWGENAQGQLGTGWSASHPAPIAVPGITDAIDVHVGARFTCARRRNRRVACWGDLPEAPTAVPTDVPPAAGAIQLTGSLELIVLSDGGSVRYARDSEPESASGAVDITRMYGRSAAVHGDGLASSWDHTVEIAGIADVVAVDGGNYTTCFIRRDRTVVCTGRRLGEPEDRFGRFPAVTTIPGAEHAIDLAVANDSACALIDGGTVRCWGDNRSGELGRDDVAVSARAQPVFGITDVAQVSGSFGAKCARSRDGTVRCWGPNTNDILGDPDVPYSAHPIAIALPGPAVDIAVGQHACAVLDSGAVWCWGLADLGQVGTVASGRSATPVPVVFPRPR